MTEGRGASSDHCYRHPDRQSFVLCQRCGRTICPECQTEAPVGVHCPECVREARQGAPRRKPAVLRAFRASSERPVVSYILIGLSVAVFALQWLAGRTVTAQLAYVPQLTYVEPWRIITSMFTHLSIFHILFNAYSLFVFGPILEHLVGRGRFLALYLMSGVGGCAAVLLLTGNPVIGASGAIFGLLGAFFIIQRRLGGNSAQLVIVIVLNLAIGFIVPNIAWEAHIGGLVTGAAVALVYLRTRRTDQRQLQWILGVVVGAALVLLFFLPIAIPGVFPLLR